MTLEDKPAKTLQFLLCSLLDYSFWGSQLPYHEDTQVLWEGPSRSESSWQQAAPTCQASEWTILEADPPAPVKPSDDAAPANTLTATSGEIKPDHPAKLFQNSWPIETVWDNRGLLFRATTFLKKAFHKIKFYYYRTNQFRNHFLSFSICSSYSPVWYNILITIVHAWKGQATKLWGNLLHSNRWLTQGTNRKHSMIHFCHMYVYMIYY